MNRKVSIFVFAVLALALALTACGPASTPAPAEPTAAPTVPPTAAPTAVPTEAPTAEPSIAPTSAETPVTHTQATEGPTNFREVNVTLSNGVVGTITQPNDVAKAPAVLMLHGFASSRDEVGNMYKNLAAALANKGIASLRIDFEGWGDSSGKMEESNVQQMVDDTAVAYDYLSKLDFVDPQRIGVIGFSLGGGIAIVSAGQHPDWYKSMVTWSSVGDFKKDFLEELGQENFDKAAKEGTVTIDLGFRTVTLGNVFFTSMDTYNISELIKNYPGALLAIAGTEDFSVNYVDMLTANAKGTNKQVYKVQGADHIYGVLSDDQSKANDVIQKTADWFAQTL